MIHQTIFAASSKTTPVSADVLALVDSADNNKLKKVTFSNLTTTLTGSFLPLTGGTLTGALAVTSATSIDVTVSSDAGATVNAERYSASANGPAYNLRKARGTRSVPAVVNTNDRGFQLVGAYYDGAAFRNGFLMQNTTTEATPGSGAMGTRTVIEQCAIGSGSLTELLRFEHATGLSMFGANPVINQNRHFRPRQYAAASLPTAASGDMIASSDLIAAPLVSDGTEWLSPGVLRKYAVTANTTISVPAGWALEAIHIENTTANAVTGGIRIGTTAGGTEFVTAWAVAGNAKLTSPGPTLTGFNTNFNFFSRTVAQTLFIEAVTAWNSASLQMSFVMRKVF
jgi:hypothetical protein